MYNKLEQENEYKCAVTAVHMLQPWIYSM